MQLHTVAYYCRKRGASLSPTVLGLHYTLCPIVLGPILSTSTTKMFSAQIKLTFTSAHTLTHTHVHAHAHASAITFFDGN